MRLFSFICCLFASAGAFATPLPRDYDFLDEGNKQDIRYIMTSLGTLSPPDIDLLEPKLKEAASHLQAVHPIRFILYILSDKRLTYNLCAMREHSFIWNRFLYGEEGHGGFLGSLAQEAKAGGICPSHVRDLAHQIGVNVAHVQMLCTTGYWERIMQLIILHAIGDVKFTPNDDSI